ncbi:PREDICTED: calmodulin-regulated spectrin-associated protein 3-like, partial [Haliaeetus leucocephalus]|uniref:calmodulin-regulated spectrin-associated protein 3-like n=1 Tax=Haliaeetus leucocephalus TaxID=52644 RepID=UPI00053CC138
TPGPELPTIEEALQIIHSSERLLPEGAPDAFYLHSPDPPVDIGDPPGPPNLRQPPVSTADPPAPSGRTMTSFAERKKKLEEAAGVGGGGGGTVAGGSPQILGGPPGGHPEAGEGLSAEMSQLGARLEEKRRAIEAQKKRIEAIFAKHRQRLGKSAFLQLKRGGEEEEDEEEEEGSGSKKQVTFAPPEPPGHYEAAVAKLSTALSTLQLDMQRLSQQQQRLLQDQRPPAGQAWVIPVPKGGRGTAAAATPPPPPPPKAPASPSPSRKAGVPPARKPPRSPRRARPAELRLPTLTRVLTPPHDVDTLPHLRKFSPSQVPVQTRSSIHFSEEEEEDEEDEGPLAGPPPPDSPDPPEMEARGNLRPAGTTRVSGDGTSDVSSPGVVGCVNKPQKNRVLKEVEKSKANHFLILFRDGSCQFRALYTLGGGPPELSRLAGVGPRTVPLPMVEGIYKYNSDRKRFTQIPAKTMSMSVDAFTIPGHLWQPRKPGTPKKPSTPK